MEITCLGNVTNWRVVTTCALSGFVYGFLGDYVQFFGIVMLSPHMRVAHLTQRLRMTIPLDDDGSRDDLFLAFRAASIVLARLQDDAKRFLKQKNYPDIPLRSRLLPNITKIDVHPYSPNSPPLSFTLLERYDTEVPHRNLYLAQRTDTTEQGKYVYVKFTTRYSTKLHDFCADKGLAPKLLGFQRLIGGWFGLVMEKVDIAEPQDFSDLDTWRQEIQDLVKGFHGENLVHGDLRLANFIFTKASNPCKMMLVDFDWGGEVGSAFFPPGKLNKELKVDANDKRKHRPITVEHDREVLAKTFQTLDQRAATAVGQTEPPGRNGMDVDI